MNLQQVDLGTLMRSDHPARSYVIVAGLAIGVGLIRGRLSGLALIAFGAAAAYKALDELRRTNELHGGNFHGYNRPPTKRIEDSVAML